MIRRNRHYGGNRAHHVDGFHVDLSAGTPDEQIKRVVAGRADSDLHASGRRSPAASRSDQYLDFSRFFLTPGLTISMYVLNSSGPLFRTTKAATGGQPRPQQGTVLSARHR